MTLELAAELKHGTIDAIMRSDDAQLRLEFSSGSAPFRKPLGKGLRRHVPEVPRHAGVYAGRP